MLQFRSFESTIQPMKHNPIASSAITGTPGTAVLALPPPAPRPAQRPSNRFLTVQRDTAQKKKPVNGCAERESRANQSTWCARNLLSQRSANPTQTARPVQRPAGGKTLSSRQLAHAAGSWHRRGDLSAISLAASSRAPAKRFATFAQAISSTQAAAPSIPARLVNVTHTNACKVGSVECLYWCSNRDIAAQVAPQLCPRRPVPAIWRRPISACQSGAESAPRAA